MLGFSRPSVKNEIDRFYKALSRNNLSYETISKSAFTQARSKLKAGAFRELYRDHLGYFKKQAPYQRTWHGKRVVAIDGSWINIPYSEELVKAFGTVKNQHKEVPMARSSFAYDVCNQLVLDALLDRSDSSEHELAVRHLNRLDPSTDILVFDRGYPAVWLMALLKERGFDFCFRMNSYWKDVKSFKNSGKDDIEWTAKALPCSNKKFKEYGLSATVEGLRMVAIELPTGTKEVLAVSLANKDEYTVEDFKELYHMRWGVEEGYKSFKKVLHIEHFSGKSPQGIKQDFYARVCMLNMSSMISTQGLCEKPKKGAKERKHKLQPNKTQVLAKTKDFLYDLFYTKKTGKAIKQMIYILQGCFEIVREGRSFPRSDTAIRRGFKGLNYKGI